MQAQPEAEVARVFPRQWHQLAGTFVLLLVLLTTMLRWDDQTSPRKAMVQARLPWMKVPQNRPGDGRGTAPADRDGDGAARTIGGSDDPAVVAVMPLESPMANGAKKSKSLLRDGDQTDDEDEEDDEDLSTGVAA